MIEQKVFVFNSIILFILFLSEILSNEFMATKIAEAKAPTCMIASSFHSHQKDYLH